MTSRPLGPRTFGKYLLDREIARGGMARVHLARLRGLGGFEKRLVLKEIDPRLASDPRFVTLFVEEANTLVQMSHPNIVPVYELGVVDGTYFLAMEHVEGVTLDALVAGGPLDPAEVAHLGAQVADALGYAHERFSLVHRDVTPRNVMIDAHGHARLLDFGIAARLDDDAAGEGVFGTPGYLSPEQARGERLTPASDLFALGAVLYRAATGEHAFEPSVEAARKLSETPALPGLADLPDELARIVRSALEPDPAARPASGKALAAQLRAFSAARRPEGVADALGARASRLAQSRDERATREHDGTADLATPPASGRTQSLATSPVLEEMMGTPPRVTRSDADASELTTETDDGGSVRTPASGPSTQRLDRVAREPAPPPIVTREPTPDTRVATTDEPRSRPLVVTALAVALGALALWALSYARFEPPTSIATPGPRDLTPLEVEPPDAGDDASADRRDAREAAPEAPADASVPALDAETVHAPRADDAGTRRTADARTVRVATGREGSITVQALPWADVLLDGERIGRTPIRERAVSAGEHELTLRCSPLGREVSRSVQVREGVRTRISADLQQSPPTFVER